MKLFLKPLAFALIAVASHNLTAQSPVSSKAELKRVLTSCGYDFTGVNFDDATDPNLAADQANYKFHLEITVHGVGVVYAFSKTQIPLEHLSNAAILMYEVGQVNPLPQQ